MHHKFCGEVLPYLEVTKSEEKEEQTKMQIEVPKVTGVTLKEAKLILNELGLKYEADTDNMDMVITNQLPKNGIKISQGTEIFLYTNDCQ